MKFSQDLQQKLLQKLSPQQIQFIKLLQLNTLDFEEKLDQEMLENPALEKNDTEELRADEDNREGDEWDEDYQRDLDVDELIRASGGDDDEYSTFRMGEDYRHEDQTEMPIRAESSFQDFLIEQARATFQIDFDLMLGLHLINSIDEDGYLRRELRSIANDLAFNENIQTNEDYLERLLIKIQNFDPVGIGARDLQECLLLQLYKKDYGDNPALTLAETILEHHMEAFGKRHYDKIMKSLKVGDEELKAAIAEITKLNPKPGDLGLSNQKTQYIIPDFTIINEDGHLQVRLNSRNTPELRLSHTYTETLKAYEESKTKEKHLKEAVQYIKQKVDGARWFIDSVKQRQMTLTNTMEAIVRRQHDFFLEGDETFLKPMILKDIATDISMDISTISRVANSKYVETEFGIFPLKFFFSEGITGEDGEEISNREIKKILSEAIADEDKRKPLTDEALMVLLKEKGYGIARRTVAKYREQLNIPVARLRKEL